MFQTIITAHRLMWLACINKALKIKFVSGYVFGLLQGFIAFASPLVLSEMIKAISEKNTQNILFNFYALAVLAAALVLGRGYWRYKIEEICRIIPLNIKDIYYEKIFNKNYDWHLHNSVGFFSSALNKVCDMSQQWLWKMPYDYVGNFVMASCFLVYTFFISFYLFLYFAISLLIMCIIIRILYIKRLKYADAFNRSAINYDRTYIDFLYNVRSVKKMNLLDFVKNIFATKAKVVTKHNIEMMRYNTWQYGFIELYINALFLIPIGYFIYNFINTGTGLEVIVMVASIQPKIGELGRQYMSMMGEIAKTKTEMGILAEHLGDVFNIEDKERGINKWKKIIFKNTHFEFIKDETTFTHNIENLEINQGDNMAVMGKSGEGKSTFLNLLTRQFIVKEGSISVDGKNYKDLPESFFNNQITYISQDVELFDMSFYDNIVMGKRIPEDKLNKVLKGCQLQELIKRMGGNLHVDIGEKGIKVSGGERQRINLARGLLLDREILVLDEITANLDPHTTEAIWKFIFDNYADKTIIAVSHEKELLKHVNRKIEFKKGKCKVIM